MPEQLLEDKDMQQNLENRLAFCLIMALRDIGISLSDELIIPCIQRNIEHFMDVPLEVVDSFFEAWDKAREEATIEEEQLESFENCDCVGEA